MLIPIPGQDVTIGPHESFVCCLLNENMVQIRRNPRRTANRQCNGLLSPMNLGNTVDNYVGKSHSPTVSVSAAQIVGNQWQVMLPLPVNTDSIFYRLSK